MVFCLSPRRVEPFVELLAGAAGQAGDDEARVRPLRPDLDPGDDPFGPAPTGGAVVELLETSHRGSGAGGKAGGRAGFERQDMAAQRGGRRYAEDEVEAVRAAPVEHFRAAVM